MLDRWQEKYPDVPVSQDVVHGHPGRALASLSARADLVVLGRHPGLPGPGSVRHAVLNHAHGPIVIVPLILTAGIQVPLGPSCPPGLRPLRFRSDRARGAGLASPSPGGGSGEFRGFCRNRASSSAIRLAGLRQLRPRLLHRGQRIRQLTAQRCHQPGQHLIRRQPFITGHTGTLPARACSPHAFPSPGTHQPHNARQHPAT